MLTHRDLIKPFEAVIQEYKEWATSPISRVPTGIPFFDTETNGGLAPAEVLTILGRTQVGKTQVALNIADENKGLPTLFVSLEMRAAALAARLAAIATQTSGREIEEQLRLTGDHPALYKAAEQYPLLTIVDKSGLTVKDIEKVIVEAADLLGQPIRLVIIDFLERIGGVKASAVEHVNDTAMKVKNIAKNTDASIVLLHQVNRGAGEDGHIPLHLGSGKYGSEEHSDYTMGIFRPCLDPELSEAEAKALEEQFFVQLLKNRHGNINPRGVCMRYNKTTLTIRPWNLHVPPVETVLEYRDFGWDNDEF